MASVTRQPFAPLNEARLQTLTSLKNRQNASSPATPAGKRKAESFEFDNSENVDPVSFSKRSKSSNDSIIPDFIKPVNNFVLTRATVTPLPTSRNTLNSPVKASSAPRRTLQPQSLAAKLSNGITKSSSLSVPAGRSPTRGKRTGLLSSRRRTAGSFTRVDPPSFHLDASSSAAAPFSLDAALKGTLSSFAPKPKAAVKPTNSVLFEPTSDAKASWFFDIHEDTPDQEMTNLLQHGTCVLDISSDEESERKATLERAEGRDKENVPPTDDVSQTSARNAPRLGNEMMIEKERIALGEMNAADYFAEGCDEQSLFYVAEDDEDAATEVPEIASPRPDLNDFEIASEPEAVETQPVAEVQTAAESEPEVEIPATVADIHANIDALMGKECVEFCKVSSLEPVDGTDENFELWESGSTHEEAAQLVPGEVAETQVASEGTPSLEAGTVTETVAADIPSEAQPAVSS